jgi:hypothetical protein
MLDVAPSSAVVAAGNVPAFVLADVDVAEILAALAPFTTPARFQTLLFGIASYPDGLEWLKHKHTCLRAAFLTSLVISRAVLSPDGNAPP